MATVVATSPAVVRWAAGGMLLLLSAEAAALRGWEITPYIVVGEIFTDNIDLAPDDRAESELVTEISPGITLSREGRGLRLSFDYLMENFLYAKDSDRNQINHRLQGAARAVLIRDELFLNGASSIRQVLVSPQGRLSSDNLSGDGNRTDVFTYQFGPEWHHDFGGYVRSLAQYTYAAAEFSEGASDSEEHTVTLRLDSGRRFSRLNWSLNYLNSQVDRGEVGDSERQSLRGEASYALSREWSLLVEGGYEDNQLATEFPEEDGSYWGVGVGWKPSRFIELAVLGGGNFRRASVRLTPTNRTSLQVDYQDRDVGLNTGVSWSGRFFHRTRYSTWSASYEETVTSVQQLAVIDAGDILDPDGDGLPSPGFGDDVLPIPGLGDDDALTGDGLFPLTDQEFLRKRLNFSVGYRRGHSTFDFRAFGERREFAQTRPDEDGFGGGASWRWQFAPRTASIVDSSVERLERGETGREDLWVSRLGLDHTFGQDLTGRVEYRHARNDSDDPSDDYRENRLSLFVRMNF